MPIGWRSEILGDYMAASALISWAKGSPIPETPQMCIRDSATRKQRQPVLDLIDQCVKQITPKADDKDIAIIAPETADELAYDAKWTAEALYNVLDNAVKYLSLIHI